MKKSFYRSKWFLTGFLAAVFSLQTPHLFAGQASRQMAAYFPTQKIVSPEESQLADYRLERAAVLRNLAKKKSSPILKQKLKILNSKITYLTSKTKKSRPVVKPSVKHVSATPAIKKQKPPIVVSKKFTPHITPKPTKRTIDTSDIMFPSVKPPVKQVSAPTQLVAKPQVIVSPAPVAVPVVKPRTARMVTPTISVTASKMEIIKPVAPPQPTPKVPVIVAPILKTPVPLVAQLTPQAVVVTKPVIPVLPAPKPTVVAAPPIKEVLATPEPPVVKQAVVQAVVIPQAPVVEPVIVQAQPAKEVKEDGMEVAAFKRGSDWIRMSQDEKEMYIFSSMGALVKHDVVSMKPSYFYIQALDKKIQTDLAAQREDLDSLFIASVYENEPDTREAIDKIG